MSIALAGNNRFRIKHCRMLLVILTIFIVCFSFACTKSGDVVEKEDSQWISLFNGKDLDGWIPKFAGSETGINPNNTFMAEDGLLKVSYSDYEEFRGEFGHLFYKTPFSRYILRIEYRFIGEQLAGGPSWGFRNSGVMIHSQSPDSMGLNQSFPVSIEAQFLGGNGTDERSTANLCTPGTNVVMDGELITQHCTNSTSRTYHGDEWVTVEIEVNGR
ncbi:MAG: DUF1080 domain-containing protein, partial [Candidatus Aminicenantes bacterium]|nr:DUF1080 domain-containing protein [Candidatus Aminicenantes bacterium]